MQIDATRPFHVGIIMDGNGRWARARGLPRTVGHRAGADAVRRIVTAAPDYGIDVLTLFAFSADNWKRPATEVRALMRLFEQYLYEESETCIRNGVRLSVIGRRDRFSPRLLKTIAVVEERTRLGDTLQLRLAVDYSARDAICRAAVEAQGRDLTPEDFGALINRVTHSEPEVNRADLIIRTSGEQRLSDFLLWEAAYAELVFTDTYWPDFQAADLGRALAEFTGRERRFGGVAPDQTTPARAS